LFLGTAGGGWEEEEEEEVVEEETKEERDIDDLSGNTWMTVEVRW